MNELPLVTVLIPARNEASDIEGCLAAVAAQDYPVNRIEIIVVDGGSEDGTADVARRVLGRWGFGSTAVVDNRGATAPSNLNMGLGRAAGSILCRVDARTRIEPHYVRTCVDGLCTRPDVAVIGGAQVAVARDASSRAGGIARALNNRLAMGGSRYRTGGPSGPAETVYLGTFRTEDLRGVGGWDERFPTNQDFDLNCRLGRQGVVWFEATLQSRYIPRQSLQQLWHQYRRFGQWKARYWRITGHRPEGRQWALLLLPGVAVLASLALVWRRPSAVLPLAAAGCASGLAVDATGSREPGSASVRLWASAATSVISLGWWSGALREIIVPTR